MSRVINLFGFDFCVELSQHAKMRSRQRNVPLLLVVNAVKAAEAEIGDYVKNKADFVITDEFNSFSFVATMQFDEIVVHTIINKASDLLIRSTDLHIIIKEADNNEVCFPVEGGGYNG